MLSLSLSLSLYKNKITSNNKYKIMNQYNNKDLYQTLGINKNASQQEINSLVLKTSPKDDPEVGKALMVLSDPQKKIEYDSHG